MTNKSFATMKTNVANDVQDTSDSMKAIIGTYINRRYFQILRAINWEAVNDDYEIAVTSGTAKYALESDFGKELYAVDSTNGRELSKVPLQYIAREFASQMGDSGTVEMYSIFTDDSNDKYVKFFPTPSNSITVLFPYIVSPVALSDDDDEPLLDFADLIETGAKADAWRYKKQFSKAATMEALFAKELTDWIWDNANSTNEVQQIYPTRVRIDY